MSEIEQLSSFASGEQGSASSGAPDAAGSQFSAGELIKQAREAAGLHIAALAVSLKVPVKKLEALETGRFDLLPDAVFVRALASSVCRSLKIDAGPVLDRLPQSTAPKLTYQGTGINAPFRAPGDGPGPSLWAQVSRPAMLWGMALLLAALVLIMLPTVKKSMLDTRSAAASPSTATAEVSKAADLGTVVVQEKSQTLGLATPAADTPSISTSPAAQAAPVPVVTAMSSPAALSPASAATVPQATLPVMPASGAPLLPTASGVVVFSAKSESWVEVTDSKGTVVLRRILAAGEVVGASGALPLSAVVGRADATQVQIRGKSLDLVPLARDNVARFEVK